MTNTAELFEYIDAMDWQGATALVEAHPDLCSAQGVEGQSPVQESVYRGGQAFAHFLADRGRELDVFECTVLNRYEQLSRLLSNSPGAARTISYDGWTALHLAGFVGSAECALLLVERGAEVDKKSTNAMTNTPLSATLAGSGDDSIVKTLLESGADPNAEGAGGFTPLHLAASRGAAAAIELLVAAGGEATPAANGQTPADLAKERGFPEVVKILP